MTSPSTSVSSGSADIVVLTFREAESGDFHSKQHKSIYPARLRTRISNGDSLFIIMFRQFVHSHSRCAYMRRSFGPVQLIEVKQVSFHSILKTHPIGSLKGGTIALLLLFALLVLFSIILRLRGTPVASVACHVEALDRA